MPRRTATTTDRSAQTRDRVHRRLICTPQLAACTAGQREVFLPPARLFSGLCLCVRLRPSRHSPWSALLTPAPPKKPGIAKMG